MRNSSANKHRCLFAELLALSCGAFKNPPEVVARAMKKVVHEFRNYFEVIEFAVCCSPKDEQHHITFKRILGEG